GRHLAHGFVNLLGTGGLVAHGLVHGLEAVAQAVNLLDDLAGLAADLGDPLDATPHVAAEFVHLHDADRDRILHVADHVCDVRGGHGGLVGQAADFSGHD